MLNVTNKMQCGHPGFNKHPMYSYGIAGTKTKDFCIQRAQQGTVVWQTSIACNANGRGDAANKGSIGRTADGSKRKASRLPPPAQRDTFSANKRARRASQTEKNELFVDTNAAGEAVHERFALEEGAPVEGLPAAVKGEERLVICALPGATEAVRYVFMLIEIAARLGIGRSLLR